MTLSEARPLDLLIEILVEAEDGRDDAFDPGFDVEFAEDVDGALVPDRDVNDLAAIAYALRAGLPVTGWKAAVRNPGTQERVDRAARQFAMAAQTLISGFTRGQVTATALVEAVAAAYLRQASNAFLAGKRALGNLQPMTTEDEASIRRTLAEHGLDPAQPIPPASLGALLATMAESPDADHATAKRLDEAMDRHVAALLTRVMRRGYERGAQERRVAMERLLRDARSGVTVAQDALVAMTGSTEDVAKARQARDRAQERARRAKAAEDAGRKRLATQISRAIASTSGKVASELGRVRRMLLAGRMTPGDAASRVNALVREATRLAYLRARKSGGADGDPSGDEFGDVDDDEEAAEGDLLRDLAPAAGGLTLLGLLGAIILDPLNLVDPDVLRWIDRKVSGVRDSFHGLRQAGERAAFRMGGMSGATPAPGRLDIPAPSRVADWTGPLPSVPTGPPMGGAVIVWWTLGAADACADCLRLSAMSPFYLDQLDAQGLHPGSGHTRCGGRCRCHLEFDVPASVCADPLSEFMEAAGPIDIVWVQEAETCRQPIPVGSLRIPPSDTPPEAAQEAFSWDADVAARVTIGRPGVGVPEAMRFLRRARRGEPPYVRPPGVDGAGPVLTQTFDLDGSTLTAVIQPDAETVRLVSTAITQGDAIFATELNVAAIRWSAQMATQMGLRLEFDQRLINEGLRRFLADLGAVPGIPTAAVPVPRAGAPDATEAMGAYSTLTVPQGPPPPALAPAAMPGPIPFTSLAPEPGVAGARAVVQATWRPAPTREVAFARLFNAFPNLRVPKGDAFALGQLDSIAARGDLLGSLGLDTSLFRTLEPFGDDSVYAGRAFRGGRIRAQDGARAIGPGHGRGVLR